LNVEVIHGKEGWNGVCWIIDLVFLVDITGHLNNLGRLLCKDGSLLSCETVVRHENEACTVSKPIKYA